MERVSEYGNGQALLLVADQMYLLVPYMEHFANGRDFVASIGVIHFQPIQNNVFYGPRERQDDGRFRSFSV